MARRHVSRSGSSWSRCRRSRRRPRSVALRYSAHARQRMAERGITADEVSSTVEDHEVSFTDKKGNPCYVRTFHGRRIKVVVAADDADFVITVIDLDA